MALGEFGHQSEEALLLPKPSLAFLTLKGEEAR